MLQAHLQALEAKLERERQLAPPQPASLSPGSLRILQRRQGPGCGEAGGTDGGGAPPATERGGLARSIAGMLELAAGMPACGSAGGDSDGGASEGASSTAASNDAQGSSRQAARPGSPAASSASLPAYLASCTFHPAITPRAQARSPRSPQELHAEWAARQQRLVRECGLAWLGCAFTLAACCIRSWRIQLAGVGHWPLRDAEGCWRRARLMLLCPLKRRP